MADSTTAVVRRPDVPPTPTTCNVKNGTVYPDPFGMNIGNSFAGIPQNLIINIILFAILLSIFVILRKRGWGSKKIPLMGRRKNEWSSVFYGNRGLEREVARSVASQSSQASPDSADGQDVSIVRSDAASDALSFSSWFRNAFLARDEFLLERSGPAAIEYFRFQRHVIGFTAILCIISIAIILPINFRGKLQSDLNSTFPKTTINNVDTDGDLLWVHVAFTMILFPMGLLVMFSYGMKFGLSKGVRKISKTLMFYGLNPRITTEEKIRKHFEEAYPDCEVTNVFLTLDVTKLNTLDEQLTYVNSALSYYESSMNDRSERPIVKNGTCGGCCCCANCGPGVDAIDFYQNKRAELEKQMLEELQSWKKTNPVFFVNFANEQMTDKVYRDYNLPLRKKAKSTVSEAIGAKRWTARLAPSAPFVIWENLSINGWVWWLRAISINVVLFFFLFFISTPAVALNFITSLSKLDKSWLITSLPFVSQFLPSILLLTISGLIPVFIYYTVRWTGYHTRSKAMRAEMKLLYTFLLLAILILPSLALTSLNVGIDYILKGKLMDFQWECAFLPDNGALFVNLMLVTAFVGAASQLLRIGQLVVFLIQFWCCTRSDAERHILLRNKREFPFNQFYPDFLLSFTIVTVYSFICPVVTPFGLLALIMKHFVDRYNLSYVYGRSESPNSVHASAINFFLVGILMQNFLMLFFFIVRSGLSSMSGLLIAVLVINGLIYIGISWFGLLKKVSLDEEFNEDDIDTPAASPVGTPVRKSKSTFIPPVLQRFEARHSSVLSNTMTNSTISA